MKVPTSRSLRSIACVASLGLVLGCMGVAPALASEAESPAFGTGTAIVEDDFAPDSLPVFEGAWTIDSYQSLEDESVSEYFQTMLENGMEMNLDVAGDGTLTLNVVISGEGDSVDGTWTLVDDLTATVSLQGETYDAHLDAQTGMLTLSNESEVMTFASVGGAAAPEAGSTSLFGMAGGESASADVSGVDIVRTWELANISFSGLAANLGLPPEANMIVGKLVSSAFGYLDDKGIQGTIDVKEDGTYVLKITAGGYGRDFEYSGTWESGGVDEYRFMNEAGGFDAYLAGYLADGTLYLHASGAMEGAEMLGTLGTLVFTPMRATYDYAEPAAVEEAAAAVEEATEEAAAAVEEAAEAVEEAAFESESFAVAALPYNAGTGYAWTCQIADESVMVIEDQESYSEDDSEVTGAAMYEAFILAPAGVGETSVTFTFARDWEGEPEAVIECVFQVAEDGTVSLLDYSGPEEYVDYIGVF